MEPSQSAIVLRNKDAAAKAKKSAVKKPTSRTANQLNFPPNPAAVKDASSAAPVVVGDGSGGVPMLLGEVVVVGAAAAPLVGPGVAASTSLVGAAADVALSDLEQPAKATEKAVLQAEGSGLQSGKVGGAKAKEKEKEENNGKSSALPRTRGLTTYNQIQEKERSHIKWNQCPIVRALARGQAPR